MIFDNVKRSITLTNQKFVITFFILAQLKGPFPSNDEPEGPYPTIVDHGTRKTLIVQDYFAGKYLGFLNITFDSSNNVESWEGLPILLDSSTLEGT